MKMKLVTPPQSEPVSVLDLKKQLRIEHNEEDDLLKGCIVAAREYAEQVTGNKIMSQQWQLGFDSFSELSDFSIRPLISVDSIQYIDEDGATQALNSSVYQVDDFGFRGCVNLAYGESWPATRAQANAVLVNGTFGYKQPPARIKQAILLIAASWVENREDLTELNLKQIPHGAMRLLSLDNNRHF